MEAVLLPQLKRARRRMLCSSFFLPMSFLDGPRRRAMWSLYLFCRLIDDMTDSNLPVEEKQRQLDWWVWEVQRLYTSDSEPGPISGLRIAMRNYNLPQVELLAIIEGMRMDADGQMARPDLAGLLRYCYCVAEAVGLLSLRIFGCTRPESVRYAHALGQAMQLTNILRDIRVDAAMGRVYLPSEWLVDAGLGEVNAATLMQHIPALLPVFQRMAALAQQGYMEAERLVHPDDRKALRPALLMGDIYYRLFQQMQCDGWRYQKPYRSGLWDVGCVMARAINALPPIALPAR